MLERVLSAQALRGAGSLALVARRVCGSGALWLVSLGALTGTLIVVFSLLPAGLPELTLEFVSEVPRAAGTEGGILSIVVSTLLLVAICLAAALPISLCAGAFLASVGQQGGGAKRAVRISLDMLAAFPSVVYGLFGNALFCRRLGLGFSLLSGGLTLACMVLPLMVRSTEQALSGVPNEYRAAARALNLSRASSLVFVDLPIAQHGIYAGIALATGRALSETAALIFTSGYVTRMPRSLWDSGRSLSVHIYDLAMNVPGGEGRAHATALLLVGIVLLSTVPLLSSKRGRWRVD